MQERGTSAAVSDTLTFWGRKIPRESQGACHVKFYAGQSDQHDFERRHSSWKTITMKACIGMEVNWDYGGLPPENHSRSHALKRLANAFLQNKISIVFFIDLNSEKEYGFPGLNLDDLEQKWKNMVDNVCTPKLCLCAIGNGGAAFSCPMPVFQSFRNSYLTSVRWFVHCGLFLLVQASHSKLNYFFDEFLTLIAEFLGHCSVIFMTFCDKIYVIHRSFQLLQSVCQIRKTDLPDNNVTNIHFSLTYFIISVIKYRGGFKR